MEVADAIGQIPITINYVCRLKDVYSGQMFRQYMEKVIIAVLGVLESCLNWFMISSPKKFFGAMVKGKNYMGDLESKRTKLGQICEEIRLLDSAENSVSTRRTEQAAYAIYENRTLTLHENEALTNCNRGGA